jgi:hypothetical protein
VARNNSTIRAMNNSTVKAMNNSTVKAYNNSAIWALDNSTVEAEGNSTVVAWDYAGVHLRSAYATVTLYNFSVCWALAKAKITKKSKTATVNYPKAFKGTKDWLNSEGIKIVKNSVILFKKVSADLKTQEGTDNETLWGIGKVLEHNQWNPTEAECGAGKFHACSKPYLCDEFRNQVGDRYVAIRVQVKDLYVWKGNADYPHKVAFRKGKVLYECDRLGRKLAIKLV